VNATSVATSTGKRIMQQSISVVQHTPLQIIARELAMALSSKFSFFKIYPDLQE
jgi:hypothetical protein